MDRSDPSYKGQSGYNAVMLAIYDAWVLKFMTKAVWKVPVAPGVDRYRQYMGHRHLDVGPGTGYFIENSDPPRDTEITLLDPNPTVLRYAARRLEDGHPVTVEADVMKPLPVDGPFDSAALSYVLHCLRGSLLQHRERKRRRFCRLLRRSEATIWLLGPCVYGTPSGGAVDED